MRTITKDQAKKIAKKLRAKIDTSGKAHDLAIVYYQGRRIASFGIRRGSKKDLPHPHIPDDLHINLHNAVQLANCPLRLEQWLEMLAAQGIIELPEQETQHQAEPTQGE
jgi:hypothetical protein